MSNIHFPTYRLTVQQPSQEEEETVFSIVMRVAAAALGVSTASSDFLHNGTPGVKTYLGLSVCLAGYYVKVVSKKTDTIQPSVEMVDNWVKGNIIDAFELSGWVEECPEEKKDDFRASLRQLHFFSDYWKTFQLCDLQLKSLPDPINRFPGLENVTNLECRNNLLTEVPHSIGLMTSLINLDLSHNSLQVLPDSFNQLKNLNRLDLSNNQFKFFPDEILSLSQGCTVYIHQNLFSNSETSRIRNIISSPQYFGPKIVFSLSY